MYIIGCDFPCWTGVLVFLLLMVIVVMVHDKKVCWPDKKYLSARYIVPLVGICLLVGPVGVSDAFPERWAVLSYAGSFIAMLVAQVLKRASTQLLLQWRWVLSVPS